MMRDGEQAASRPLRPTLGSGRTAANRQHQPKNSWGRMAKVELQRTKVRAQTFGDANTLSRRSTSRVEENCKLDLL